MTSKELEAAARRLVMRQEAATTPPAVRGRAAIILDQAFAIAEARAHRPRSQPTPAAEDVIDLRGDVSEGTPLLLHPLF